jgi:chloramphenicol 3-O phosphotransferase
MKLKKLALSILKLIRNFTSSAERPVVIFLNGTSSAGKSSIAEAIQKIALDPRIHTGFDDFALRLPSSYIVYGERSEQGYHFVDGPDSSIMIEIGPVAQRLIRVKHRSMKAFLEEGFNLIVDELLLSDEEFKQYIEVFRNYRVIFVGIKPPLEVVEEREKMRGDRILGLARSYHELTHKGKTYDLMIDSSQIPAEKSAQMILDFIRTQPDSKIFQSHNNPR